MEDVRGRFLSTLVVVVLTVGCSHVDNAGDDAGADADTDADTDTDTDADVDTDTDTDADTDTDTGTGVDTETVTDTGVLDCIWAHDGPCDCQGACQDGFGYTVYYPEDAGEFPPDTFPSEELLAAGVGWLYCSVCDTCDEWKRIRQEGEWVDVDVYAFCAFIVAYDAECGGCLVTVSGGGG